MLIERRTPRKTLVFEGRGLHTGEPVTMTIHPASDGIHFRLGSERTKAAPENVSDTTRSTRLGSIGTIEHLMSAFCGLGVTDAEVELTAGEVPGMDGSALPYVQAMQAEGFEAVGAREMPELFRRVFFQDNQVSVAVSKGHGSWRYEYLTGDRWPKEQVWETHQVLEDYSGQVAPARTFAFSEEVPVLLHMGLGQGLDESSVLILGSEGYENEARFCDEPARHKLLDVLGDLYLAGVPANHLSVVATRSGHKANVKVAGMILESLS
ncbi:MAG TPA: UDP-3-O-acyl-N-acetylglucosamine deacetylase [Fimbriimonas sp.]|nr:UDP-3-O-acyl-N-acetylglucosamine deacetylase [Fimbriimonas sp.]